MGRTVPAVERRAGAHYVTTVFALDVDTLGIPAGFTLDELESGIEGHVLDRAQIVPTYTLNPSLRT
jgi:phosphatidylethanolamine-binding protein (PEBP) family uncharacterized protein